MRIHIPEISVQDQVARISARVEMRTPPAGLPDTLWFEVPSRYTDSLSHRADAFVASLLMAAMERGEDIEACAPLSPHLARGMEDYQYIFSLWTKYLRPVRVHSDDTAPVATITPAAVGCAFSGGVDSFYTLYTHLPTREPIPDYRITHALFVHGFDIPLNDEASFALAANEYQAMLEGLNIQLIPLRTNSRDFIRHLDWEMTHGTALLGAALTLEPLFSRFYIPSSQFYGETGAWGSDYRTDPLLSTRTMQFVHDGAGLMRADKIAAITHWPETYARLRVCWKNVDGLNNCCRCEKCLRTMAMLEIYGALPCYTTFAQPFDRRRLRFSSIKPFDFIHINRVIEHAAAAGREDIASDLRFALRRNRLRALLGQSKRRLLSWFTRP